MKHQFKQFDGVICQSQIEGSHIVNIAHENGYKFINPYKFIHTYMTNLPINAFYIDTLTNSIVACMPNKITNPIPPEKFIKLVTQNTFVLPQKWCVKVTEESVSTLAEFYAKHAWEGYIKAIYGYIGRYTTSHNAYSGVSVFKDGCESNFDIEHPNKKFQEITFEQFKSHVLNQNTMNQEIIGYKLIKPEYRESALKIAGESVYLTTGRDAAGCKYFTPTTATYSLLKKAGVLDLWFEPVYKEDKIIQIPKSVIEKAITLIDTYTVDPKLTIVSAIDIIQELKQYISKS